MSLSLTQNYYSVSQMTKCLKLKYNKGSSLAPGLDCKIPHQCQGRVKMSHSFVIAACDTCAVRRLNRLT